MFSVHKFEISERNMYVRRFLPTYMYAGKSLPEKEINRYRNRIAVAYPLTVKGHIWKPFASYEAFYDQGSGWTKNRVWTGVTVPVEKHVSFQPSYMWEGTNGIKDLHYLMFGLIFRTSHRDKNLICIQHSKRRLVCRKCYNERTAMLAVIASLVFATAALAQMPTSPWKKARTIPGSRMKNSTALPSTARCT